MQGESTSEESNSSETYDECVLFIDDSNIFIEGQKYYARHLKLRVSQDPRCRLDIGKLVELALDGRTKCHLVNLYGSEPPALDTVWNKIREQGLHVKVFQKDFKGKEKQVDTSMTADAVRYALKSKARKHTVIIIAGDSDYCPIVKTVLEEKSQWKIELLAFERSISKHMKNIKNDNFKINTFEVLLQEHTDSCCFVEARWRTELYRIPKDRTIVLRFKTRLISPEANEAKKTEVNHLLKQYAVEVTYITGVPCCYHLSNGGPNAGRQVYVIGYTMVRAEPGDRGIDFFRICRDNAHGLNTKCSEICHLYETYHTAMETEDRGIDCELQLQNRFATLDVEKCTDEDRLSHIHDNVESVVNNEDTDTEEASGAEGFTKVKSSSKARRHMPRYSESCRFEFCCSKGQLCDFTHTPEEISFFKANGGQGRRGYKSTPCRNFLKGNCKHGHKNKNSNCPYYHSQEEARCYVCKNSNLDLKFVGHASHDEICPSKGSNGSVSKTA